MIFKPIQLGTEALERAELLQDRERCKRFGPCGVGEKALYMGTYFIDCRYYVPWTSVRRVYKRVAMSKGGFTGKGVFATIPYLVVEFDDGREGQSSFKYEELVDQTLAYIAQQRPELKLHSARAEAKLAEAEAERRAQEALKVDLSDQGQAAVRRIDSALEYLDKRPDLTAELSMAARKQRAQSISSPVVYRWVSLLIVALGVLSAAIGLYQMMGQHRDFEIYLTFFAFAAIFIFAGVSILPTMRSNRRKIAERAEAAKAAMDRYLEDCPGGKSRFPLPACYAHPVVLKRMRRALDSGRADDLAGALERVKQDLQALNSGVQVTQEEYDEVIAIKALFLNEDYR